jgi:hypothetical protein
MPESMPATIIGIDLTDTYARRPRAVDIAILDTGTGDVKFDHFEYPATDDAWAAGVAARIAAYREGGCVAVVDGPQGLAKPQENSRQVERLLRTPGHTPWQMPRPNSRPFAGYIRTSVEFFAALVEAGWRLADLNGVDASRADLYEAYPGAAWPRLHDLAGGALVSKATEIGREQRTAILNQLGCRLTTARPTHDQLDAAICAALGWRYRQPLQALQCSAISLVGGIPVHLDGDQLREGRMLNPARDVDATAPTRHGGRPSIAIQPTDDADGLPRCDWVYFAGGAQANCFDTYEVAIRMGLICRTTYNSAGQTIASVRNVRSGHTVLLMYRLGNGLARPLGAFRVDAPNIPVADNAVPAMSLVTDPQTANTLTALNFQPDPSLAAFTAFDVSLLEDLSESTVLKRPSIGNNAIWRYAQAFRP